MNECVLFVSNQCVDGSMLERSSQGKLLGCTDTLLLTAARGSWEEQGGRRSQGSRDLETGVEARMKGVMCPGQGGGFLHRAAKLTHELAGEREKDRRGDERGGANWAKFGAAAGG